MYPHERSLVKRLEDAPFALVGINSDPRENLEAAMERANITWRSFWDGGDTSGPIATRWNVTSWPTIYVLDAQGTIRFRDVRGPELDAAIDELLREMGVEPPPASPHDD